MTTKSQHEPETIGREICSLPEFVMPPTLSQLATMLETEQSEMEDPLDALRAIRELRNFVRANEGPMLRIARESNCGWDEIRRAIGFNSVVEAQMVMSDEGGTP